MNGLPDQVPQIVAEAKSAAHAASHKYFTEQLGGRDQYACGFASTKIYRVKGSTRIGKALIAAGLSKSYDGSLELWNPGQVAVQNIDCLEAGANAAAVVFRKYGFEAYGWSRLD